MTCSSEKIAVQDVLLLVQIGGNLNITLHFFHAITLPKELILFSGNQKSLISPKQGN